MRHLVVVVVRMMRWWRWWPVTGIEDGGIVVWLLEGERQSDQSHQHHPTLEIKIDEPNGQDNTEAGDSTRLEDRPVRAWDRMRERGLSRGLRGPASAKALPA